MTNIALIFPGQGAQVVGMGKDFYESSPHARAVIDQADGIWGNGLKEVMFAGPSEKLTSTAYCQPAILTMSIAALQAFRHHPQFENVSPKFAAGLSLGEYSALAAAEALSFEDTLRLVERRSFFMEEATRLSPGKMAAIIGLDKTKLNAICAQTGAEVANFNSPQQIVITGHAAKVEAASQACKDAGAKSVIPLDVGGAFHSSLMKPAADKFKKELEKITIRTPKIPVVSNVDGRPAVDPLNVRKNLAEQITSSVQWVASIEFIVAQGVDHFIEVGPGTILKGLLRRINPALKVFNVEKFEDLGKLSF